MASFTLNVNGETRTVDVRDPDEPLLYVLRNALALTGAKYGCGLGPMRLVHGDRRRRGRALVSASRSRRLAGKKVTTIEGLGTPDKPHPLQAAFVAEQAAQCGYCVTGMVMTGAALLARKPRHHARRSAAGARRQPVPLRYARANPARDAARIAEGRGMRRARPRAAANSCRPAARWSSASRFPSPACAAAAAAPKRRSARHSTPAPSTASSPSTPTAP